MPSYNFPMGHAWNQSHMHLNNYNCKKTLTIVLYLHTGVILVHILFINMQFTDD